MRSKVSFRRLKLPVALFTGWFLLNACAPVVAARSAALVSVNAITLSVSPNPAKVKQRITLTAKVTTNSQPATGGTVTFFDGKLLLAGTQVVGKNPAKGYQTGSAILMTILAPGPHSLTAVYGGTASSPKIVRSHRVALKVTGKTGSTSGLTAKANSQHPKNYDFTAKVHGFGLPTPRGTVDFTDVTASTDLGKAMLDAKTASHSFAKARVTDAAGMPVQSVVAPAQTLA